MSANAQLAVPENGTERLTYEELEHALELSSQDPDAVHDEPTKRVLGTLHRAAVAGVSIGLANAAPDAPANPSPWGDSPFNYLELGSDSHDSFVH